MCCTGQQGKPTCVLSMITNRQPHTVPKTSGDSLAGMVSPMRSSRRSRRVSMSPPPTCRQNRETCVAASSVSKGTPQACHRARTTPAQPVRCTQSGGMDVRNKECVLPDHECVLCAKSDRKTGAGTKACFTVCLDRNCKEAAGTRVLVLHD